MGCDSPWPGDASRPPARLLPGAWLPAALSAILGQLWRWRETALLERIPQSPDIRAVDLEPRDTFLMVLIVHRVVRRQPNAGACRAVVELNAGHLVHIDNDTLNADPHNPRL